MTRRIVAFATLLASTTLLAACSGSSTYGTGVSQESQLISDLAGIVPIGTEERKEPIDYSSRPKLVRAPADDTLPTPAEASGSQSAYFPTNPEERRANRYSRASKPWTRRDGGVDYTIPENIDAPSASGERADEPWRSRRDTDGTGDKEPSAGEMALNSTRGKEARLKRMKELSGGAALGTGPRKYLTQPPEEYRKPAETAAVGSTGEYEYGEKENKPIFGSIFSGRNTKENVSKTTKKKKAAESADDS